MLKTIVEQKLTEANQLREENNKVRELLVSCKLSENAGETIFQGAMQIGLLLLSRTGKILCYYPLQSEPTDLTGYVSPFLSRTGIRMPVRLELYRHTYACMTGVIQAYVCLYDSG